MTPSRDQLLWMYRRMLLGRTFEEALLGVSHGGRPGRLDPDVLPRAAGREASAVAVCAHLRPSDLLSATEPAVHLPLAKGVNPIELAAEALGRDSGLGGGHSGRAHLCDGRSSYWCAPPVGDPCGLAFGWALSGKMQERDGVAVAWLCGAAAAEAEVDESIHLAAMWRLPLLFVIEEHCACPGSSAQAGARRRPRVGGPGDARLAVDDTLGIFAFAGQAVARARAGLGPSLLRLEDRRPGAADPILALGELLVAEHDLGELAEVALRHEAARTVAESVAYARYSPRPHAPEAALVHFG